MTDALERIEREAKERRAKHGTCQCPRCEAEAAVDELKAMVKEQRLEIAMRSQEMDLEDFNKLGRLLIQARADVLKLRGEVVWWANDHNCCAGHERELMDDTQQYEQYR